MFNCQICNRNFNVESNLKKHLIKCEKISNIKEIVIDLYVNQNFSYRELKDKFKLLTKDVRDILKDKVRTLSESNKINRLRFPDSYKHSEDTKKKLREIRLEYMKNNPEKTAWRIKNLSYPEKLFLEKIYELGLDKKYSIIREYAVFPYFIDFAFVNEFVAVEIDGSQHLTPERKEKDEKKDRLLNNNGWVVIRISEKEIKTNIVNVFNTINDIIINRPKIGTMSIGVVEPKKKYKKQIRDRNGLTSKQKQSFLQQRKVERPDYLTLIDDIEKLGYRGTGVKYGVSDNSIRKWKKYYENRLL